MSKFSVTEEATPPHAHINLLFIYPDRTLPLSPVFPICPGPPIIPGMPRGPGKPCGPCGPAGPGGPGGPGGPITPAPPRTALLALTATAASRSVAQHTLSWFQIQITCDGGLTSGKIGFWEHFRPRTPTLQHLQDHFNDMLVGRITSLQRRGRWAIFPMSEI